MGVEVGAQAARSRALAVLRIRSRAVAVALLPAALAVVLLVGGATGHIAGGPWGTVRRVVTVVAAVVLLAAAGVALVITRARPAMSPTVPVSEASAPDLYRMVRDLADRLDVPAPSAIALTPDCDSWLEDRTHRAHRRFAPGAARTDGPESGGTAGPGTGRSGAADGGRRAPAAPVLVIGSPFLWWMRVGELRAVLAPVVAGTGPSAHPDIAAARRFVRGLDAAVAVTSASGRGPLARAVPAAVGWVTRLLLRGCRVHAAEMERGVAAAAAERAQAVDYGVRIVAQEQVGLAYAGWDRLLTRVALPAWRMGRWPSRLDVGVVAALTELSRRDRLAEGFTSRLGERPACDLLEEPGAVDEATSLLAARLFHGGPAEVGPDWAPVDWQDYPDEVVDRTWRTDAARLHRVLDALGVRHPAGPGLPEAGGPTLARVLDHLTTSPPPQERPTPEPAPETAAGSPRPEEHDAITTAGGITPGATGGTAPDADDTVAIADTAGGSAPDLGGTAAPDTVPDTGDGNAPDAGGTAAPDTAPDTGDGAVTAVGREEAGGFGADGDGLAPTAAVPESETEDDDPDLAVGNERTAALAAGLTAEVAREEAAAPAPTGGAAEQQGPDHVLWDDGTLPLFPLQPPRSGRDLLADHVTAMVCCAAMDTAGATPGLDWLDGPSLLVAGERAADLGPRVLTLVETGDPGPLREWLRRLGVRPEKPVRLV
ncbi:hypothetical protein ACGFS9_09155 [Streptomyces sp. NPDC048566]|uniref:hypothetical protein n=1 Tax=Streptomyces sp. NPDC048566 TaxID=3365569 RepID=UPI0037225EFD